MTYVAGDETFHLGAGDFISLPRNVPHAFRVTGASPVRFLGLTLPGMVMDLYDEVGVPAGGRRPPAGGRAGGRGGPPGGGVGGAGRGGWGGGRPPLRAAGGRPADAGRPAGELRAPPAGHPRRGQ